MDAFSIMTGVLTITTRCITVAIQIHSAWNHYRDAPQTVADLVDEIQIVHASLTQLQHVLRLEGFSITSDLEDVFGIAVKGCKATLLCLEEEFRTLQGRSDWRARIKVLWEDDTMTRLLEQLGRKKTSIMLLMQCLHLRTMTHNDCSLAVSYPQLAAPLVEALDRDTIASIVGSRDSMLSTTEFSFDQEIVNTRVYRENMTRLNAKGRSRDRRMSDDESTVRAPSLAEDSSPASGAAAPEIVEDLIDLSDDFVPAGNPATLLSAHPDLEDLEIGSANLTNVEPMVHTLVSEQILERPINPGELRETNVNGSLVSCSLKKFPDDEPLEIWDDLDDDPFSSSAKKFSGNDVECRYDSTLLKSPLYNAPSEKGIDRISSNDVLALMKHLTIRDSQRMTRDTENLVNLCRSAAQIRNSFEQMKKHVQEQDALINKSNKDVPGVTGGPPQPLSGQRPQEQPLAANMILEHKRRNVFKSAPKVLGSKSDSDMVEIEQMLMQLLDEVEALKAENSRELADHSQEALPDTGGESESIHASGESQKSQVEGRLTTWSPYGTCSIVDTVNRTTTEPVPARQNLGAIRTPQMIMKQRREREARRQAETDAARDAVRDAVAKSTDSPGPVPPQSDTDLSLTWRGNPLPTPTFLQPERDPSLPLWEKLVPSKNLPNPDYQSKIPPDTGVIINRGKRGSDRKMNESDGYTEEKVRRMKIGGEDRQSARDVALAAAGLTATALGHYEYKEQSRSRESSQKQILEDEQTAKKLAPNIDSGTIPRQSRSLDKERIVDRVTQRLVQKPLVGGGRENDSPLIPDSLRNARRISANMETNDRNGVEASTSHAHAKRSRSNTPVTLSGTRTISTINNPKLLEAVEEAIKRPILPQLDALKDEQREQWKRSKTKSKFSKADLTISSSTIANDIKSQRLGPTAYPAQSIKHTLGTLHSASRKAPRWKVTKARVETPPAPVMDLLDKREEPPLYSREKPYTPIETKRDPELRSPRPGTPDSSGSLNCNHPDDTPHDAEPFWGNRPFLNPNAQDNLFVLDTDAPDDSLSTEVQLGGTRARTESPHGLRIDSYNVAGRDAESKTQTSLLIEYIEGGKQKNSRPARRPFRVRVTPSKKREQNRVQITESKSHKLSLARRIPPLPAPTETESVDW